MPRITLEELQTEVNETYEPLVLDVGDDTVITLQSLLLMPKVKRDEFQKKARELQRVAELEADPHAEVPDVDAEKEIVDLLALVADDPRAWRTHFSKKSLGMLQVLMNKYMEATQGPEASGSPS